MATISKDLLNLIVRHQIDLQRYGNGVVRDIIALLNAADKDLAEKIRKRGDSGTWTARRLNALLAEIRELNDQAYWEAEKLLVKEMHRFAADEAEHSADVVASQMPPKLSITSPSVEQLAVLVDKTPITVGPDKKLLLEEIFTGLAAGKEESIRGALRLGIAEGETVDHLVRRLIGTRANRYTDGIIERHRRGAEAIVRTVCNHVSNQATQSTYGANKDLVRAWIFTATLDSRTTITCSSLSGREFPVGEGPIPPRHPNCRSVSVPKLASWKELGFDVDEMPPTLRASKDGPVAADITFDDWLRGQPKDVQTDILGATRQKLFADGMKIEKFTNDKGVVYTLDALKSRNKAAFDALK